MELAIHRPGPPLGDHVETMTYFVGFNPQHQREKLIPDGAIELIVDLSDRPKKLYRSELGPAATDFRRAWISGMQRQPIVIEAQPQASLFVIRFRPGGAYGLVRHAAQTLTDAVFALSDVLDATSLRDCILEGRSPTARFAAAEAWLLARIGPRLGVDPTIRYLAARLGRGRVRDLVETTGFTERHIRALFHRHVGVSPKQFARIERFRGLLRGLSGAVIDMEFRGAPLPPQDWARLALDHGYSDQPHLVHEFRAMAGMTPGAYLAAYRGLENYLPIVTEPEPPDRPPAP